MKIGILALQGAFAEHEKMLTALGAEVFQIRQRIDLDRDIHGLVIPGGESTVQGKLLRELGMFDDIRNMIKNGLPVFGTCAGLLLLAKNIENDEREHLGLMDITAVRNAYGRQLGSFAASAAFGNIGEIPMTFIRAPYIKKAGKDVEILAQIDGRIVAARQNNMLVTAFHPELTQSAAVHEYFLEMVKSYQAGAPRDV